jgi:preprotein translocase subunit SecD
VKVTLTAHDAVRMSVLTSQNVGRTMAILADGEIPWGAPLIRTPITGGKVSLTLRTSLAAAERLAATFRAGKLPAPLELVEQTSF